jgi:arylsulfatase A-like enzyme
MVEGARTGVAAWLGYGVLEFALAVAIPRLFWNAAGVLPWQWALIGLLFAVYAAAGSLLGAAGGAWLARGGRVPSAWDHRCLASLILAFAFVLNLGGAWPVGLVDIAALVGAVIVSTALAIALHSTMWQRRMVFLASPVTVSLALLAGPWLTAEFLSAHSVKVRVGVCVLAMAGVLAMAALQRRIFTEKPAHWLGKAAAAAGMPALFWVAALAPKPIVLGNTATAPASPGKPNIVLITMDTVRADHVSVYGYERETTPFLREFSHEATLYERAIACDGFTLPTHASLFTGLYPGWHGAVRRNYRSSGAPLAPNSRTLAGMLRDHGYWTGEAAANYGYLGEWSGLSQGFTSADVIGAAHLADPDRPFYLRESARKALNLVTSTAEFDQYCRRASDINSLAFAMLDNAGSGKRPFFLFLNYMDAHAPYLPPQPFATRFADRNLVPVSAKEFLDIRAAVNGGKRPLREGERRYLVSQYDGGIAYVDSRIGELLARLRALGLYESTMIVITSDHGEAFGEHNLTEHAFGSLYQDQLHVPLLIKYPGQHEARRSSALVSQVDFMPTILDVAGVAVPPELPGRNLRSLSGRDSGVVFAESEPRVDLRKDVRLRGARRAVLNGDWKLIDWTAGPPELYNLADDPGELHNLYRPEDAVGAMLQARVSAWASSMPRTTQPRAVKPVAPAVLNKLRSLGYAK